MPRLLDIVKSGKPKIELLVDEDMFFVRIIVLMFILIASIFYALYYLC